MIDWQIVSIAAVVVTGFSGSILAWLKLRPENTKVAVEAAEGAVISQATLIQGLERAVARLEKELEKERGDHAGTTATCVELKRREIDVREREKLLNELLETLNREKQ